MPINLGKRVGAPNPNNQGNRTKKAAPIEAAFLIREKISSYSFIVSAY